MLVVAACGPGPMTATGVVVDVRSSSLVQIDRFTLRMTDGSTLDFAVGTLELDGGAFPAGHLREHMALVQPVAVAFREEGGARVAYRLVDAPWLRP